MKKEPKAKNNKILNNYKTRLSSLYYNKSLLRQNKSKKIKLPAMLKINLIDNTQEPELEKITYISLSAKTLLKRIPQIALIPIYLLSKNKYIPPN